MKLSKLEILKEPFVKAFYKGEPFSACGLFVKAIYDDGSEEFLKSPYIDIPDFNLSGAYLVKVYKNKEEKEIYTSYYVAYSNYKNGEIKGLFISNQNIQMFSFVNENKEYVVPVYLANNPNESEVMFMNKWGCVYKKDLVDTIIQKAKEKNIIIVFKELS